MIQRMLTSALVAGCAAWLLAAVLHFAFVQKYILLGEEYETGTAVHYAGVAPATDAAATTEAHSHDGATAEAGHTDDAAAVVETLDFYVRGLLSSHRPHSAVVLGALLDSRPIALEVVP